MGERYYMGEGILLGGGDTITFRLCGVGYTLLISFFFFFESC